MTAMGLGDVIMDLPAIRALKQKFPDARLTVLSYFNSGGGESELLHRAVEGVALALRQDAPGVGFHRQMGAASGQTGPQTP